MHVLLADAIDESAVETLTAAGHTVDVEPALTTDDLPGRLDDVDALVVRSTKVNEAAIAASAQLSLIVRAGAG